MPSIAAELKTLRQQVEKLQVEVAGRESLGSMVVWDEQNQSYVNQKGTQVREDFSGLIVHLTSDLSPLVGTEEIDNVDRRLSQNEFEELRLQIIRELSDSAS